MLGRVRFLSKTMATCLVAVPLWLSNGVENGALFHANVSLLPTGSIS